MQAQSLSDSGIGGLQSELTSAGFENLALRSTESDLTIAYENRIYRSQHRALSEVLKAVAQSDVAADSLHILMLYREQPMSQVSTSLADLRAMIAGEISYPQWQQGSLFTLEHGRALEELRGVERAQRTRFRPELSAGLGMRYQLGNYNNPYRFAFDLEPGLDIPLGYGISINSRMAIPLYNDFDLNTHVRPILIALSVERKITDGIYAAGSTGIFTRNRRGWHVMAKGFLVEEVFSITVSGGQTQFTPITGRTFLRFREDHMFNVYTIAADYRWRRYDLNIRAEAGRFLYSDEGYVIHVHRHFGEATFGFFYNDTKRGTNYGFQFSLPIFPKRYRKAGPVILRTDSHFPVTYRYVGNDRSARLHETGITLDHKLMQFYPSYLRKEMEKQFKK